VAEQRYKAVLAIISEGRTVTDVATEWRVSRQTMHTWLARYESGGLEELSDRSHRPVSCPHQLSAELEAMVLELRRWRPYWGARRIALELARRQLKAAPSESAVYRCLVRAGVIDPAQRHRKVEHWKRWERAEPMELWQMDVVGGLLLSDGTTAKVLTGIDDHSPYCVSVRLMPRERTHLVCDGFSTALRAHGVPQTGAHRQRQGLHRQVLPATGGGALRPHLPGARGRAPAHPAPFPHHHRQDRALPPHPAAMQATGLYRPLEDDQADAAWRVAKAEHDQAQQALRALQQSCCH